MRQRPYKWIVLLAATLLWPLPAMAGEARLTSPVHEGNAMAPVWSPDGRQIAYEVSYAKEKYVDLFVIDRSGSSETEIEPSAGARSSRGRGRFRVRRQVNHEFAWSPSGQLYAFSSSGTDDEFDIHVKGVSVPVGTEHKEGGVAFSRDGLRLVFTSEESGKGDLYLAEIYGLEKAPRRLTQGAGLDFYATWSPVADVIAYTGMGDQGSNIRLIEDISDPFRTDRRGCGRRC